MIAQGDGSWWRISGPSDNDTYNVVGAIDGRDCVGTKSQDEKA